MTAFDEQGRHGAQWLRSGLVEAGRGALRAVVRRLPVGGLDGMDPDVGRVVGAMDALPAHRLPVPALRAAYRAQTALWQRPDPAGVLTTGRTVRVEADRSGPARDVTVVTHTPPHPTGGVFVHLHGGGFVIGSPRTHAPVGRRLAAGSGAVVHAVDYRLAPEHPFPAGMLDALQVWSVLAAEHAAAGGDPARIGVGGDSAGGHLAALVADEAVESTLDVRVPRPGFCWLVTPSLDTVANAAPAMRDVLPTGVPLTGPLVARFDELHRPGREAPTDPALSPLRRSDEVLAGHPRTWVQTAAFDPLCRQGEQYATRLAELGVDVEHAHEALLPHEFASMAGVSAEAAAAVDRGVAALRRLLRE